jgi:hypothetical protein
MFTFAEDFERSFEGHVSPTNALDMTAEELLQCVIRQKRKGRGRPKKDEFSDPPPSSSNMRFRQKKRGRGRPRKEDMDYGSEVRFF